MNIELVQENVDLFIYPKPMEYPISNVTEITLGDLHANALKLVYFLLRQDIISLPEEDYFQFVELYSLPNHKIKKNHLERFDSIINGITTNRSYIFLRLLGDDTSDRGSNDYFTLKICKRPTITSCNNYFTGFQ